MNSTTEVGRAHCMPDERGKTKTKPPEARHTRTLSSDAATATPHRWCYYLASIQENRQTLFPFLFMAVEHFIHW